jgi:thiamine-phosphate diphosphorylase
MTAGLPGGETDAPRGRPCPRLVALSDEARLARPDALARVQALAQAGCPAILLRAESMMVRPFYELAREAAKACHAARVEVWIGDHADVAVAIAADGVQLPAAGLSITGARRVAGERMRIGRSAHSAHETARAAAEGADHVILGAIFATTSHPGVAPAGVGLIEHACATLRDRTIPILAIGGMTPQRAQQATASGAWGVAALAALWDTDEPALAVHAFLAAIGGDARRRALH